MLSGIANRSMLTAAQAAALLEIDRSTFVRFVAQGHFTTQTLPGMAPRYSRADVEAFRDRHTTQAARPPSAMERSTTP